MNKAPDAFRTISEVSDWLDTPTHVLRFWESRFPEIAPVKRAGGRRYYRPEDMRLIGGIKKLLHDDGVTIKSLQERLKSEGVDAVSALSPPLDLIETPEDAQAESDLAEAPEAPPAEAAPTPETPVDTAPGPTFSRHPASKPAGAAAPPTDVTPGPPEAEQVDDAIPFQRHPRRRPTTDKPADAPARAHPSRTGLFVYDDSKDLPASRTDPPRAPDTAPAAQLDLIADTPAAPARPALGAIDSVPADPKDDVPAENPVPLGADLRACAAERTAPLPPSAANAVTRLKALRERLA